MVFSNDGGLSIVKSEIEPCTTCNGKEKTCEISFDSGLNFVKDEYWFGLLVAITNISIIGVAIYLGKSTAGAVPQIKPNIEIVVDYIDRDWSIDYPHGGTDRSISDMDYESVPDHVYEEVRGTGNEIHVMSEEQGLAKQSEFEMSMILHHRKETDV